MLFRSAVGANLTMNTTVLFIGNSTVNTSVNSSVVYTGSYNTASDKKLKSKIKQAPSGLINLKPKQFVYKSDPSRTRYGFIAQEVQEHFPDLVSKSVDGTLSLNYNDIIALLLQELINTNKKLEALEKKIYK